MTAVTSHVHVGAFVLVSALLSSASPALAQSQGVVTVDASIIWRTDAVVPATTVRAGTVLDITARSDRWYEVIIPENLRLGGLGERGVIAIAQVELTPGTPLPPFRPVRPGAASELPQVARAPTPQSATGPDGGVNVGGFGQVGYMTFAARETFSAVFGESWGPSFGGGGHVRFRSGLFLTGSVELLRKTGERVFALEDGTVFRLGIPNTLTLVPIAATVGYRLRTRRSVVPYVGGGVGVYLLKEETPFHEAGDVALERQTSYHGLGGVEFRTSPLFATAVEGQYTVVPNALGTTGVSVTFRERDLGGFKVQVKLMIGR